MQNNDLLLILTIYSLPILKGDVAPRFEGFFSITVKYLHNNVRSSNISYCANLGKFPTRDFNALSLYQNFVFVCKMLSISLPQSYGYKIKGFF